MPQFDTIVATTELEAVNAILNALGEAPITDLDTAVSNDEADIVMIKDIIRRVQRDTLTYGWKFNTEFQVRIAIDGNDQFPVPTDMLAFEVSKRPDQMGHRPDKNDDGTLPFTNLLDIVDRAGFFYDRLRSVDTFTGDFARSQIFIDKIIAVDFTDAPQSFRRFVVARAGREALQSLLGATDRVGFTDDDVAAAWRTLRKDQGDDRPRSMVDDNIGLRIYGGRPKGALGN